MRYGLRVIFALLLLSLTLSGCRGLSVDPYSYLSRDFCADLHGARGAVEWACRMTVREEGEGRRVVLDYSAPDSLSGVSLSLLWSGRAGDLVTLTRGTLSLVLPFDALEGLLSPADALLTARESLALQRGQDGSLRVTLADGELLLRSDGVPLGLSLGGLSVVVDSFAPLN